MTRLSDTIEIFIKDLIEGSEERKLQIQRNELASYFSCAPSQINYVLTTRFTIDKGYYIESRRGGGGYIIIKRINYQAQKSLLDILNEKIGDSITSDKALQIVEGLFDTKLITERELKMIKMAINDRTLGISDNKNKLRSDILKAMILVICN